MRSKPSDSFERLPPLDMVAFDAERTLASTQAVKCRYQCHRAVSLGHSEFHTSLRPPVMPASHWAAVYNQLLKGSRTQQSSLKHQHSKFVRVLEIELYQGEPLAFAM